MKKIFTLFIVLSSFLAHAQGPIMDICLVTVDSNSTHNIIVWEKTAQISVFPIDSVKIYRTALGSNDTLVGVVPWDSLSAFHDYSADPNLRAHRYRISGVNNQGMEGPQSLPHQTMHFSVFDNGSGNLHLVWTPYFGETIDFYNCWSDSAGSSPGWQWVNSTSTDADTSWWDNATPQDLTGLTYLVDVTWNNQCSATKAQDHNSTRSNRSTMTQGGLSVADYSKSVHEFGVFPNPVTNQCTIVFSSSDWIPKEIEIIDATGKIVKSYSSVRVLGQYKTEVDLSDLSTGVYQVMIKSNDESYSKQLIKL